jgi:hypothetical protein
MKHLQGLFVKNAPRVGQAQRPAAALNQQDPELLLKELNLSTQWWLCNVHLLSCTREVLGRGNCYEIT